MRLRLGRVFSVRVGTRLYLGPYRLHHGFTGACIACVGLMLMLHDRKDWPWPLRDK